MNPYERAASRCTMAANACPSWLPWHLMVSICASSVGAQAYHLPYQAAYSVAAKLAVMEARREAKRKKDA